MFVTRVGHSSGVASFQGSLLASGSPEVPTTVGPLQRHDLGGGAWVDWCPDWLGGADAWFDRLACGLEWQQAQRPMYERIVEVPRLIWNATASTHPSAAPTIASLDPDLASDLTLLSRCLSTHYDRPLVRIGANWYRSGADSVAPHADRVRRPGDAIVAIVSVGERRTLTLRPAPTNEIGAPRRFDLGRGDLFVMGGTTQALFQHGIAKAATQSSRISLMFREPGTSTPDRRRAPIS